MAALQRCSPRTRLTRSRRTAQLLVALLFASPLAAAQSTADLHARNVTQLADRWVAEVELRFPMTYLASGLPTTRNDAMEQNAPQDIAAWRQSLAQLEQDFSAIPEAALVGRPEWVIWHHLRQGLTQSKASQLCRNELWQVSPFGWQAQLAHFAAMQPVATDVAREQALARWRQVPAWTDQEITNLRDGLRLGYSATQSAVRAVLTQLDTLLATVPSQSPFMSPAQRGQEADFLADWARLLEQDLWPALLRYRNFLRDEYLPRARSSLALSANTDGLACYRATIFANTTVDEDPRELFVAATARQAKERELAVNVGRKLFGPRARDWGTLASLMRADPRSKFASTAEVNEFAQRTYTRAAAAIDGMITRPPLAEVKLEPYPQFAQGSGPGGEYVPGAEDGSRPPMFYFRNDPQSLSRASFESLIFHETMPGHHLQAAVIAQSRSQSLHPITRVLWFSGPGEGWATYAEDFARELGLYGSDFDLIGALMLSTTAPMVADLGIQVMGWNSERATRYLIESRPLLGPEQAARLLTTITGHPGLGVAYPLGAMQFEQMRADAEQRLGRRFEVREFHRVMLEDGRLPFGALRSKLERWIESQ